MDYPHIICWSWIGFGFLWFIYVMVMCIIKKGRVTEGTLLGCVFIWPVTLGGYVYRLVTGKRNRFDPLDLTDFGG